MTTNKLYTITLSTTLHNKTFQLYQRFAALCSIRTKDTKDRVTSFRIRKEEVYFPAVLSSGIDCILMLYHFPLWQEIS